MCRLPLWEGWLKLQVGERKAKVGVLWRPAGGQPGRVPKTSGASQQSGAPRRPASAPLDLLPSGPHLGCQALMGNVQLLQAAWSEPGWVEG